MNTSPRIRFSSPGFGARGFTVGWFAGIVPSGGLVTVVSGGNVSVGIGASAEGAQAAIIRMIRKCSRYFILTPNRGRLINRFVPQNKRDKPSSPVSSLYFRAKL